MQLKSCPNNLLQRSFSFLSRFNSFGYNYWPYTLRQSHAQCLTSPLKAPLSRRRFRYLKSLLVAKKRNKILAEVALNPLKNPGPAHNWDTRGDYSIIRKESEWRYLVFEDLLCFQELLWATGSNWKKGKVG